MGKKMNDRFRLRMIQDLSSLQDKTILRLDEAAARRISDRIKLWSALNLEVTCLLIGKITVIEKEPAIVVEDFIEIPVLPDADLVARAVTQALDTFDERVVGVLRFHPDGNLYPNFADLLIFLVSDLRLGRPHKHVIVSPSGESVVLSFSRCWNCENSFFKAFPRVEVREDDR
ncbi:MAG: hypothetical protein QW291_09820 [Thermofilaceae archaeon]